MTTDEIFSRFKNSETLSDCERNGCCLHRRRRRSCTSSRWQHLWRNSISAVRRDSSEMVHWRLKWSLNNKCEHFSVSLQPCINYVAAEGCLLLVLNRTDFMNIVAETPEVLGAMRLNLKERMSMARNISEEELSEKLLDRRRFSVWFNSLIKQMISLRSSSLFEFICE